MVLVQHNRFESKANTSFEHRHSKVSHSAQYFLGKCANLKDGSRERFPPNQTAYLPLGPGVWPDKVFAVPARRNAMHPEELMKPDLLSEIVLLTFVTMILASVLLFLATTLVLS
jgi:hypothetical protein